jgi:phosphatidylserine/phosphatidylglycerophosphate/cardiolipin synthase-like enzyme
MLIDGDTLITGSMNFTLAADEENAENILILTGKPKIVEAFQDNFEKHWKHAEKFGE